MPSKLVGLSQTAGNVLLAAGPFAILLTWFASNQWAGAGPEARAWLLLTALLAFATVLPLPGQPLRMSTVRARLHWWAWAAVAALVAMS
jgi:hypothetical protein